MTRAAVFALPLALALAACGTTGGEIVTFDVTGAGVAGGSSFDTGLGWHVELTRAHMFVGAVYLNLSVPISGAQDQACILDGVYTAQELSPLDVDVLSTTPQPFPAPGTGTTDEARTGEVWLTSGDVNAPTDTTVIVDLAGSASLGSASVPFTASITISEGNRGIPSSDPTQPSQHPICKERIVTPIAIDLRPKDGATLAMTIDPTGWFDNVDFTQVPADGVFPDDDSNQASQNLFTGVRAATRTFQLSFD